MSVGPVNGLAKPRAAWMQMRIAYLVNWYPMVSLTFIRREIAALEEQGFAVDRYAVEPWPGQLVDRADLEEAGRTRYVKRPGVMLSAVLGTLFTRPAGFLRTLGLALRLAKRSDKPTLWHLFYLAEACVLARWLRQTGARHVHAHFASNAAEIVMLAHELGGPGYSFTVHGPEDFDRATVLNYPEKIGRAAFVAAISDFCRSQLYRWVAHRHWEKIAIVRCGLDHAFLQAKGEPVPAARRLVCVGRLCEQKGHLLLMQAAAQVKAKGLSFELVLVGDGELRGELERLIGELGLGDTVRITGWRKNDEVLRDLAESRALVLPSFAEGLPVVIMESLAVERPVVTTQIAGVPELVVPGETGWLVPAGNVERLAEAMEAVLRADPSELHRMGRAGRERVAALHDVVIEAGRLGGLIREAVAEGGEAAAAGTAGGERGKIEPIDEAGRATPVAAANRGE